MTPELREQVVQHLKRWDFNRWQADAMICDFIAPLLAEERRAGAEQAWDEGWREGSGMRAILQPRDNPYRADRIAGGQP